MPQVPAGQTEHLDVAVSARACPVSMLCTACVSWDFACGPTMKPQTSAARGGGTGIPARGSIYRERHSMATPSRMTWRESGSGRRHSPRRPRYWPTCGMWPTASICARTYNSTLRSGRLNGLPQATAGD